MYKGKQFFGQLLLDFFTKQAHQLWPEFAACSDPAEMPYASSCPALGTPGTP